MYDEKIKIVISQVVQAWMYREMLTGSCCQNNGRVKWKIVAWSPGHPLLIKFTTQPAPQTIEETRRVAKGDISTGMASEINSYFLPLNASDLKDE